MDKRNNGFLETASEAFDKWLEGLAEGGVERDAYDALRNHAANIYGVTPDSALAKTYALFITGVTVGTNFLEEEPSEEEYK